MRPLCTRVSIAVTNWYYRRRIRLFFIISIPMMVGLGFTGAYKLKWIVDELRIAQIIAAAEHKPTASIEIRKTDKMPDRYTTVYRLN